jgi:hypothetical protein
MAEISNAGEIPSNQTPVPASDSVRNSPDSALTEDLALAKLKDPDIDIDEVERLAQNASAMKSRKVRLAMAAHARTPRRIALRVLRELYTFELMHLALLPVAPADLKRMADEFLMGRLASITLGERIALARRCSGSVAGGLLLDKEPRVWQTALENSRLTESGVVKALQKTGASRQFVEAVCYHAKWSTRIEVRNALLRNTHTPVAKAIEFARRIPPSQLREILDASRLPESVKRVLRKEPRDHL